MRRKPPPPSRRVPNQRPMPAADFAAAVAHHRAGRLAEAKATYEALLAVHPNHLDGLHLLGVIAAQEQDYVRSIELISRAIALSPDHAAFHANLGNALQETGDIDGALASYDRALALMPEYPEAWCNRGNALRRLGRLEEALASHDRALALKPDFAEAWCNRGLVHKESRRFEEAAMDFQQAIAIDGNAVNAHSNLGNTLKELGRRQEALAIFDRVLALKPTFAEGWYNRANTRRELKLLDGAAADYGRALALKPDYAEAHCNLGNTLRDLGDATAAVASYDRAIACRPDYAEAWSNRGNALKDLRRLEEAVASYRRAIELKPDFAEAHSNCGVTLQCLDDAEGALECFRQALAIKPDYAEAWYNIGNTHQERKEYEQAIEHFDRAIALNPDIDFIHGHRLFTKMRICDWRDFDRERDALLAQVRAGRNATPGFPVLAMVEDPALQRTVAAAWAGVSHPRNGSLGALPPPAPKRRICIGYFSADYFHHATAYLTAGMFEQHDRDRFELIAFSFGPDKQDDMQKRLAASFDRFIDVSSQSDADTATQARSLGVDIAVDLKGFTYGERSGIFACRAAPIQINYLGYPGTMGMDYMDYLIADRTVIPDAARTHYAEKIVTLPHTYQVNDATREISSRVYTRRELGLPEQGFVFCCFNNNYKILPDVFSIWMRLLQRVTGSVLWLLEDNPAAARNLRAAATARGVDPSRLVFAKRMPLTEHLARHRAADLFLDTRPYNAHTTASDALWAGLPVLTCAGESFASRVAASLLTALGMPELITTGAEEYEARALQLASDPGDLAALRRKVTRNRETSPLFDTRRFTRHIEQAYGQMFTRHLQGLPPADMDIPP